jgi:alpha-tubulin suppressor-like RCC1 family protein
MATNPEISIDLAGSTSTFLIVPFEEIIKFLSEYDLPFPLDKEAAYLLAWEYLVDHEPTISSVYLQDFMLAYSHQDMITDRYSSSYLLASPEGELIDLARTLGLPEVNREQLIRILGYLDLLDNDVSIFDRLSKDILEYLSRYLDYDSLCRFSRISSSTHRLIGMTDNLVQLFRTRLSLETKLDLAHFTKKELGILSRMNLRLARLATMEDSSLVLTRSNQVFVFGNDLLDKFGLGRKGELLLPTLKETPDLRSLVALANGYVQSLLLNAQGQVFIFGTGALGLGKKKNGPIPELITAPKMGPIVNISAGYVHFLLLTSQGQVFSFGNNPYGQLGLGHRRNIDLPTLIEQPNLGTIKAISAGYDHSLLLNTRGQVFSFGQAENPLGFKSKKNILIPTLIDTSEVGEVIAIAASKSHFLILNLEGQVFAFGSNGHGKLGVGDWKARIQSTPIDQSKTGKIKLMAAGKSHSLFLNTQSQVFACGRNDQGQLGLGDKENRNVPTLIDHPGLGEIVTLSVGEKHSLIANSQGQVFGFGDNFFGQLGLGDKEERHIPTLIERLWI